MARAGTKARTRRASNTGAIYKDGDSYRVRVLVGYDASTGKPKFRKVRAASFDEAVQSLQKLQVVQYQGKLVAANETKLAAHIEKWLEETVKPTKAPKTYASYAYVLRHHVVPTLGRKKIDQVKRADVQKLAATLLGQCVKPRGKEHTPTNTLSRRTVSATMTVLHSFFENAIANDLAARNPATKIELPRELKKPPQFLTAEQVGKLTGSLKDSPVRELVLFLLSTGTRLGEARGVRWTDLNLAEGVVRIAGQLQRLEGRLEYRPTTKTNQDRQLPLPRWLADELKQLQTRQMVDDVRDPDGIVFLNREGRRFDEKYVNVELRKVCAAAEIPLVSPHKLRHTAATLALQESGDLHAVQKMLGHQQVALTADLYGHATSERLRPISDKLGSIVKPA